MKSIPNHLTHINNASLLHDIIYLFNVIHDGDRYLISEVPDPKERTEVIIHYCLKGKNTNFSQITMKEINLELFK